MAFIYIFIILTDFSSMCKQRLGVDSCILRYYAIQLLPKARWEFSLRTKDWGKKKKWITVLLKIISAICELKIVKCTKKKCVFREGTQAWCYNSVWICTSVSGAMRGLFVNATPQSQSIMGGSCRSLATKLHGVLSGQLFCKVEKK